MNEGTETQFKNRKRYRAYSKPLKSVPPELFGDKEFVIAVKQGPKALSNVSKRLQDQFKKEGIC